MYIYCLKTVCICSVIDMIKPMKTRPWFATMLVMSCSLWHSIKHDATYTVFIKLYLQSMLKCTKHTGIEYCPKTLLRMVCKICLEGRGNSDWRKVHSLGPHFRMDRTHAFPFKHHLRLTGLCQLFLTAVAKNLELNTFTEDERVCIRGLLSNWQSSF